MKREEIIIECENCPTVVGRKERLYYFNENFSHQIGKSKKYEGLFGSYCKKCAKGNKKFNRNIV